MSKDVFFQSSDYLFKLRAWYLIIKDNKILLARDYIGSYFYLPGGKIDFGKYHAIVLSENCKKN